MSDAVQFAREQAIDREMNQTHEPLEEQWTGVSQAGAKRNGTQGLTQPHAVQEQVMGPRSKTPIRKFSCVESVLLLSFTDISCSA